MNFIKSNLSKIIIYISIVASVLLGPLLFAYINTTLTDTAVLSIVIILCQFMSAISFILLVRYNALNSNMLVVPVTIFFGYLTAINLYSVINSNSFVDLFYILFYALTLGVNIYYINGNSKLKSFANVMVLASMAISLIQIDDLNYLGLSQFLIELAILFTTYLLEFKTQVINNEQKEER